MVLDPRLRGRIVLRRGYGRRAAIGPRVNSVADIQTSCMPELEYRSGHGCGR